MGRGSVIRRELTTGEVVYDIKYRIAGRQRMERNVASKRKDAERILNRRIGAAPIAGDKVRFGQVADEWYAVDVKGKTAPATTIAYRGFIENHLKPAYGKRYIDTITPREMELYFADKQKTLAPSTVNAMRQVAKGVFGKAIEWGLIGSNPVNGVKRVRTIHGERPYLSKEDVERLLDTAEDRPREKAIILLAVQAGMREGEIFALRAEDVDFDRNVIHVRRKLRQGEIEYPKSHYSRRVIPMTPAVRGALAGLGIDAGYIFAGPSGEPLSVGGWMLYHFRRLREQANIDGSFTFHGLRHTFAAHAIAAGVGLEPLRRLMGHSSVATTSKHYGHVFAEGLSDAIESLEKWYHE